MRRNGLQSHRLTARRAPRADSGHVCLRSRATRKVRAAPPGLEQAIAAARSCYRTGAYAEAEALLAHHAAAGQHPAVLRLQGMCRLRTGAIAEAVALLQRVAAVAPDDPET